MSSFEYFNYFTQIEEYFWSKRGAHLLVSPLDWAILETWQQAGIPAFTVMKGIDRAFDSYQRSKRGQSGRQMKSLGYCVEAVLDVAAEEKEAAAGAGPSADASGSRKADESFSREDLRKYFLRNGERLASVATSMAAEKSALASRIAEARGRVAAILVILDSPGAIDLEDLERRLTVIEEKLTASMASLAPEELLLQIRRELDRQLAPYRSKMSADQLAALELRYMRKRLFEAHSLPRLSLFYLGG
jgi:hypothetical protein